MNDNDKNKKNKSSKSWLHQHLNDPYVQKAQKDGYRSRAAYKLLEIDQTDDLFRNVKNVVDLGSAPGSWTQVVVKKVPVGGLVVGVDILNMAPLCNAKFIQGDFTEEATRQELQQLIHGAKIDLVLSDMAPNLSGIKSVDQIRALELVELALNFARDYLKVGGNCVIKIFAGSEFTNLIQLGKEYFKEVVIRKPLASRSKSSEVYMLCKNKK